MALPTVSADEPRWLMTSNHMNPSKGIRIFRIRHGSAWAFGNLSATAIKLRLAGVRYWRRANLLPEHLPEIDEQDS